MEETTQIQFDLSVFNPDLGTVPLNVPSIVDGKGANQFPRNENEKTAVDQIIMKLQGGNVVSKDMKKKLDASGQLIQAREDLINNPIQSLLGDRAAAAREEGAPGLGTAIGEFADIFPGGQPFEPGKITEGLGNFAADKLVGKDVKSTFSDMAVIGGDMAFAGEQINARDGQYIPNGNRTLQNAFFHNLKKNPVAGAGALVATNVASKGTGNIAYDLINDATRVIMGLPNPDEAYLKDEKLRNLMDMRDELLFSGGAMGLQAVWPNVKRLMGRGIFGIKETQKKMIDKAKNLNIPMNVFSVSPNGFVSGAGKVIGLFPFVATKARQAQNIQQVALAENVNKILNNLSPISLFADSSLRAVKGFSDTVKAFSSTKTLLYKRAMDIGDKIGEAFIPTSKIKEQAQILQELLGKNVQMENGRRVISNPIKSKDGYTMSSVVENFKKFTGDAGDFEDALINLQYLKNDFMTAREFTELQTQLNKLKKVAAANPNLGETLGGVDNFTNAMIESLNDFKGFKVLDDPAKAGLTDQFGAGMQLANDFFFQNKDTLRGRTSQIIKMADKNAVKVTDDVDPGFYTNDMLTRILLNDESMMAPLAIKEMKEALGDDAVRAMGRSFFDDKLRNATSYISGDVKVFNDEVGLGKKIGSLFSGKEIAKGTKTVQYNIPILQIDQLKETFGITNFNKRKSMIEIMGEGQFKKLEDVINLAEQIQQTSFGDVSEFVKRRGFLGGINAITNLAFGGIVAADPFGNLGAILMARYGMSKMADPKFLDSISSVMNPDLSELAKRQALIKLGQMAFDDTSNNQNVPQEIKDNYDPGNPMDVMKILIFGNNQAVTFPGSEGMVINTDKNGYANDVEVSKASDKTVFSESANGVIQDINEVQSEQVNVEDAPVDPNSQINPNNVFATNNNKQDPFLNVDFEQAIQQTGVGMGNNAGSSLNSDQRIALAGGDLDEAIALGRG